MQISVQEKQIQKCIESLQEQDYSGKFEIIVSDNGSQDKTASLARGLGVRVISCSKTGVAHARQAGAEAARGDIVVQADADTVYPAGWLRRLKIQFEKHPEAVAVAGTFVYLEPPWWACFEYFLRTFFGQLSSWVLGRSYIVSGANFAFRKKVWMRIGGYEPNAYSSDQIDISTRLSAAGKIFYDRHSVVKTSNRSVAKPASILILDLLRHLSRFARNKTKSVLFGSKNSREKSSSISTGTYFR